jgi:uncharacterized membrane protein YdjX (TVP38/TMEM64 family)
MDIKKQPPRNHVLKVVLPSLAVFIGTAVVFYFFRNNAWDLIHSAYDFLTDREEINAWIDSFGKLAPVVFIAFQILQVVFAPVPGEATGFIGGYLFGALKGFIYSSIGLTVGSWLNFVLGRFLGKRYIRKLIPTVPLERFDKILKRQGIFVVFIFFIFPGFPKDYLCLFLGLSNIPFKVFILLAAIGRMPGTLMLSLQGAYIYQEMYGLFVLIFIASLLIALIAYLLRNKVYQWAEKS